MTAMPPTAAAVEYPDTDGKPMADNTKQYEWIVTIKGNLDVVFQHRDDVFVAGDHLIYAQEGNPKVRQAPDVYVALGRPKGHRGSYQVWREGGVFPQVVFEVLSPSNRGAEMARKFRFYDRYGADEYYVYDPDSHELSGWLRTADGLEELPEMDQWVSPALRIRFDLSGEELTIYRPDNTRFLTFNEIEGRRAEAERQRDATLAEANRLRELLRQAGIDPDAAR